VSGLLLRSLIYFELIVVQDERHESSFSFFHANIVFPATFVEEAIFSPSYVLGAFDKNQVSISAWILHSVLHSVPLVLMSAFVSVPGCFYCYGSVV
jgi:hypothetical protein